MGAFTGSHKQHSFPFLCLFFHCSGVIPPLFALPPFFAFLLASLFLLFSLCLRQAGTHSDSTWNNNWLVKYSGKKAHEQMKNTKCSRVASVPRVYMWATMNMRSSSLAWCVWQRKGFGKAWDVSVGMKPHISPVLSISPASWMTQRSRYSISTELARNHVSSSRVWDLFTVWRTSEPLFCRQASQSSNMTVG